jgi:succinate-semialdehyde dehydrogenase/glutarate-semialdehyde dehydrogenase
MAIATVNPATGETVSTFAPHDSAEVDRRIGEAHDAFVTMKASTFADRSAWMHAAADLVESDVEHLAQLMTIEMGKPIGQARNEALKCARSMRFYADRAEEYLAEEVLAHPAAVGASRASAVAQPLGVVLAVMPWNYPMWQAIRFAAPALMAGNAGLLKHASNVPQIALYLDTLFDRAGFPAGSFRSLLIAAGGVEAVLRDPRVQAVTLTGSEAAGRSVAAVAGEEIKKSLLELGGSDPFLVMPSADLETAATTAVTARMQNTGQSCVAAKRFLVHADVYDAFVQLFTAKVRALIVGDPLDPGTDIGPMATRSGREDVAALVDDAVGKGATVLTGGSRVEGPGWFFEPTVLADLTGEMRIVMEETFGPVASVYRVATRQEAVDIANQTSFGLSSSVWTTDPDESDYFARELVAGAVFINGMTVSYPELPFGGVKNSGYGRELSREGIREFVNIKTVWRA